MLRAETAPDTALKRWLVATPSLRCSESVIAPWLGTASAVTHFPQTADRHFDRGVFATILRGTATIVSVPNAHAVLLHSGNGA